MNTSEELKDQLNKLIEHHENLINRTDRDAAFSSVYAKIKKRCEEEVIALGQTQPDVARYIESFSNQLLNIITSIKRNDDMMIHRSYGKIELSNEIVRYLSAEAEKEKIADPVAAAIERTRIKEERASHEGRSRGGINRELGERPPQPGENVDVDPAEIFPNLIHKTDFQDPRD